MPKSTISKLIADLNNVQALPDVVVGQPIPLKATFDEAGNEIKAYVNTVLTEELNGPIGANKIGLSSPNLASDNVGDSIEEVRQIAVQAQGGTILPNSIINEQLSADVKVGSLGSLTTTNKSSVTGAINELDAEVATNTSNIATVTSNLATVTTNLDIARTAKTSTGSSVAYALDTDGTFDLTKDGNILTFIPNVSNTGSCTINVDGQGAITIQKPNYTGTLVATETGDIILNRPTTIVRRVGTNVFILRPSGGGSNIKSIQRGNFSIDSFTLTANIPITSVDPNKSVVRILFNNASTNASQIQLTGELTSATNVLLTKNSTGTASSVDWEVIEFNNVKSMQKGFATITSGSQNVSISPIVLAKTLIFSSIRTAATNITLPTVNSFIASGTTTIRHKGYTTGTAYYQVVEFN
jgi:hypothetical protein